LTRKRYEKLGYVFYPEYESLFSDTEFGEHAKLDGVVIDARHLLFEHVHYTCNKRDQDAVDLKHGSNSRWESGKAIYYRRKSVEFVEKTEPVLIRLPQTKHEAVINAWKIYTDTIRGVVHSVSLEASLWLCDYLRLSTKKSAIDIGANFESYVLASHDWDVLVCDLIEPTIEATANFIESRGFKCKRESYTQSLLFDKAHGFDLVFVNAALAESHIRHNLIVNVAPQLLAKGGVILLNDGHYPNVSNAVDTLVDKGWHATSIEKTMDRYNRFWVMLRQEVVE
jgi:hypothetical protein